MRGWAVEEKGQGVGEAWKKVLGKERAGLVEEGRSRAGQGCDGILLLRGPARHCVPSAHLSEREELCALVWEAGNSWVRRAS